MSLGDDKTNWIDCPSSRSSLWELRHVGEIHGEALRHLFRKESGGFVKQLTAASTDYDTST
jgi:hypothetical protein